MNTEKFSGCFVAIVTPMMEQGEVDYDSLRALLDWHVECGTDGVVVAGTTGESPTLSMEEHRQVIAETVRHVDGRVPVVAGVGANSTQEAVELTRHACEDGADAGLSVVPYYNKPTQEGLYRHFSAIAECSDLPIVLYDVPSRCVARLADETVARLATVETIVGIKDSVGEVGRVTALRRAVGEVRQTPFLLISGDDATSADFLLAGGDGVISVTANVAPRRMREMVAAARQGDEAETRRLDRCLSPFHVAQGVESNPIPVKAALRMMGRVRGGIRLPLTPLAQGHEEAVRKALEAAEGD